MTDAHRRYKMTGEQQSLNLVGILWVIFLATRPVLCRTLGSTNSTKSNNLEYDLNLHGKCALGNPLPESFAGQERNPPAKVAIIGK